MNPSDADSGTPFAGRYVLADVIGQGAVSVIHRAYDRQSERTVALKIMDPRFTWGDPTVVERLRREVLISRSVTHRGAVRVYDLAVDGDRVAVVQELVVGESLAELIARTAPMPIAEVKTIIRSLLEVLAACHTCGVIHRDVRPSNVMIEAGDEQAGPQVRLMDFGIARVAQMQTLTGTAPVFGTLAYAAPELLRGERPDHRADLYGAGVILFEMLTGETPRPRSLTELTGDSSQSLATPASVSRSALPGGLEPFVRRLLEPLPILRPPDAFEALRELDQLVEPTEPSAFQCLPCGFNVRSSLAVCPRCGARCRLRRTAGRYFVRLRGVDPDSEYPQQLQRLFGNSYRHQELEPILAGRSASCILATGLSKRCAEALAADAMRFGGAAEVGVGRPAKSSLRDTVSERVLLRGIAAAVLLFSLTLLTVRTVLADVLHSHRAAAGAVFLVSSGTACYLLFQRANRSVLAAAPRSDRKRRPDGAKDKATLERDESETTFLARQLSRFDDTPLRTDLAMVLDDYWACRAALREVIDGDAPETDDAPKLSRDAVRRALELVQAGSDLARELTLRPASVAARELAVAEARRHAPSSTLGQAMTRLEQALREEVRHRNEGEDLLAFISGRLAMLRGVLRRLHRAAKPREDVDLSELRAEVKRTIDELASTRNLLRALRRDSGRET